MVSERVFIVVALIVVFLGFVIFVNIVDNIVTGYFIYKENVVSESFRIDEMNDFNVSNKSEVNNDRG